MLHVDIIVERTERWYTNGHLFIDFLFEMVNIYHKFGETFHDLVYYITEYCTKRDTYNIGEGDILFILTSIEFIEIEIELIFS